MRVGELLVDLQRTAEFEDGFLKLFVFQQRLSTRDMLSFGFFRRRARAQNKGDGKQEKN